MPSPYSSIPPSSPSKQALTGEVCTAVKPAAAISGILSRMVLKSQLNACKIAPPAISAATVPDLASVLLPLSALEVSSALLSVLLSAVSDAAELPVFCSSPQPLNATAVPVSINAANKDAIILLCK